MQFAEARTSASAQNPTIFNFNKQPIQIVVKQYEPWFIASDVAKVLGYREASNAVRLLDQDEADTHIVRTRSENGVEQERKVLIVNESGLYALVLKSRKPEAKPFRPLGNIRSATRHPQNWAILSYRGILGSCHPHPRPTARNPTGRRT